MDALNSLLPDGLSALAFFTILMASFAGSFVTVAFGIGGGILTITIMASFMPPAALIPVHGVVQLFSNGGRALVFARSIQFQHIRWVAVGTLFGCVLGGLISIDIPPRYALGGLGLFVIWTVLASEPRGLGNWPFAAGTVSAFLTMFFGATGMFIATHIKALNLGRREHVGTQAAIMALQHLIKVLIFGVLGFAFAEWILVIAVLVLAGFLGTLSGKAMLVRVSDKFFRTALNAVLLVLSVRLIWLAVVGSV